MNNPLSTSRSAHIWARLFRYGLDELRAAYDAAREGPDRERVRLEAKAAQLAADVAAGSVSYIEESDDGRFVFDRGEHLGEMAAELESVFNIVREAFTISLYHFWERQLKQRMKTKYNDAAVFAFLKEAGCQPVEPTLTALRLSANLLKHGDSAGKLFGLRPDLFDRDAMQQADDEASHEYLRITDKVIDEFFESVRASGPRPKGAFSHQAPVSTA